MADGKRGRKLKEMPISYWDLDEYIPLCQAAPLVGTSPNTMKIWLKSGMTPMGEIKEGYHYYKIGPDYRFCKDRLCELFGIKPKAPSIIMDKSA